MMDSQPANQTENTSSCPQGCCQGNSRLKITTLIIGALIAIGLFANFYLQLQKSKLSNQAKVLPTPTQVIVTPTIDEIAKWKTYTDNIYKFSIKYPIGLFSLENVENGDCLYSKERLEKELGGIANEYSICFSGDGFLALCEDPISKSCDRVAARNKLGKYEKIIINGIDAYKNYGQTFMVTNGVKEYQHDIKEIFIPSEATNIIRFYLAPYSLKVPLYGQEKYEVIFDQILSTFRFLP